MAGDESNYFRGNALNTALSPSLGGYTNVQDALAAIIAVEPVAPTDSHTATTAFTQVVLGTPLQNTATYAIQVAGTIAVSSATAGVINVGVGPTATPTVDPILAAFTGAGPVIVAFSAVVPAGYYLSLTKTGAATTGTVTSVATPL